MALEGGSVDYPEMRRIIHAAIAEAIDSEENESTLLSGWNLIWEGVHEDNRRSLTYLTSDATGENPLTPWGARGMMRHIEELFFTTGIEDDEDEEYDEHD
jgi:hypothetical protein